MAESKGVWIDRDTGKVVTKQPARARQLVAPGKEMTPQLEELVDRFKANVETTAAPETTEKTVTTTGTKSTK